MTETLARSQTFALRDGRQLGCAQWGAPDGEPILYLHGGLGSRLERHCDDETLRRVGARLITVDRPGHGLSSPHPGRSVLDFAADLGELMDQLHLPTVTPVGFSMGGLYVMALAVGHPERVRGATIISGIGLVDRPGGMDGLAPRMRRTFRSSRHTPRLARLEMQANVAAFKHRPAYAFGQMRAGKETLDPEFQRAFREALLEGARQGAGGFISDIAVGTGPWGFDPAEVGVPIQWWHGEKDRSIPLSHAQYLTGRLPNAELNVVRGGGHFMVHTNFESVLSGLMGHQKGSPARTGKVLK